MKRIFTLALSLFLLLSCTGCSDTGFIAYLRQQSGEEPVAEEPLEYEKLTLGTGDEAMELDYLPTVQVALQPESSGWPQMGLMDTSATVSYGGSILRFRSVDAEGKPVIFTMTHIARMLFDEVDTAQTKAWLDAYKANKKSPDAAMSEYLGVDAVRVDGGWVLDFGTTYATDNYNQQQPLAVHLSVESAEK